MSVTWGILFVLFLFIEVATVNLVSIWFAFGAAVTFFVSGFVSPLMELVIFLASSIVFLVLTKPLVKKFKMDKIEPTNVDRVIGKKGFVVKTITPKTNGQVKVLGSIWTACSDETIEEGCDVLVEKIDGVKLIVKKEDK